MGKILIENIKDLRKENDLTQADLSDISEINLSTIKQIESGRTETSLENMKNIARSLKTELKNIYLENYRETKIITVCSNKGGAGKSTLVGNLGYSLNKLNYKVLLIDTDMQMNLSNTYGYEEDIENSIYAAIGKEEEISKYIKTTNYEGIDIVISDYEMATSEMLLFTKEVRETVIKRMLDKIINEGLYDFIIFDTQSHLGLVNLNCMSVSQYGLVPVELSSYGIKGVQTLMKFIEKRVHKVNPEFKIIGVVPNRVDNRENMTGDSIDVLKAVFGDVITNTSIPVDAQVKKSQWDDVPLQIFDKASRASKAYEQLAREVIKIV